MPDYTCSIPECANRVTARGWCNVHYRRWMRSGTTELHRGGTTAQKLVRNTVSDGDCLVWTGCRNADGYGQVKVGGKVRSAHLSSWEISNGPLPAGMEIDHICHNRACVKVDHLRAVSRSQNMWNRNGAQSISKTGIRGVRLHMSGKYEARLSHFGVPHYVGVFETIDEAESAVSAKRAELFGEYAGRSRRATN